MKTRLPDFLIIGAQKSGTTTLYADLAVQPTVCMSSIKEPSVLIKIQDPDKATAYYGRLFEAQASHRRFGEASTLYSQLPHYRGVAERARSLLGPALRLLYIVRNPVERAISHHHHAYQRGRAVQDVNQAVRSDPRFVDNGRYSMQLEPWLREFGRDAMRVIQFETYVRDRAAGVSAVGEHLSVSVDPTLLDTATSFNKSEGNRIYGYLRPILGRDLWRLWIRPRIPARIRSRIFDLVGPKVPPPPPPPRLDTIDWLIEKLAPDAERLPALLGPGAPSWDLTASRRKYAAQASGATG